MAEKEIRDWADNPLTFAVILTFIIFGIANVSKAIGNHFGWSGLVNFFGGNK